MEFIYLSLYLLSIIFILSLLKTKKEHNQPPSPPSLPILGHIHLLKPPIHRTLWALAQTHGPIISLQLGRLPVLVVSDLSAAEECFTKNDVVFANRPNLLTGEHLSYDYSNVMWAPYGPHWRNLRRVTTITTLSTKRVELAGSDLRLEIRNMVRNLVRRSEKRIQRVDLNMVFGNLTRNLVMRVINGKPWVYEFTPGPSSSVMNVCDFLPVLRWVGYKGIEKGIKKMSRERDVFIQSLIDEQREIRRTGGVRESKETMNKKSLLDELLDLQDEEPDYYTDRILKGFVLAMLLAGSDTSARTLEWAMSLLINHPKILDKARNEINTHVGTNRMVDDPDLPNLSYIRWIINETLRLFPPVPLLLPHYSSEDCTVGGYHVPKGTILLVNAWALHRDPALWEDPDMFKPERFENEGEGGFKFMPFGAGRRSCPGNNFALRNVTLVLATLIQCFDWKMGEEEGIIDLSEGQTSLIMPKDKPLHAICCPRSSMDAVFQALDSE